MQPEPPILVSVLCTAYNHELYLRQCLDSLLMQQTDFRYEIIVHEDVSTDGTRTIVEEYAGRYPDLIVPIYQTENQYSKGNLYQRILFPAAKGKYIAICEGDDFWTDPCKLQKQVDIMEADPQCGLVCTFWQNYNQTTGKSWPTTFAIHEGYVYEQFASGKVHIRTLTALFRKTLTADFPLLDSKAYHGGDSLWFPMIVATSRIRILPEITCTYRILPESACHHSHSRKRHIHFMYRRMNTALYINRLFPLKNNSLNRKLRKKALIAIYKEALVEGKPELMPERHIPFFPMLTGKKILYTLLSYYTTSPRRMACISRIYNKHLD